MPDNKQKGRNTLRYFLEARNTPTTYENTPQNDEEERKPPKYLEIKKKSIQTPPKPRKLEAQKSMMRGYFEKFQKGDTSTPPSDNGRKKLPHSDSEKPVPHPPFPFLTNPKDHPSPLVKHSREREAHESGLVLRQGSRRRRTGHHSAV